MFERVHVEGSDRFDNLFLQASQSYEYKHCIVSRMPNMPSCGERKVAASGPIPIMALLRVLMLFKKCTEACSSEEDEAKH